MKIYCFQGEQSICLGGNYYACYRMHDGKVFRARLVHMYEKEVADGIKYCDFPIACDQSFLIMLINARLQIALQEK